MAQPKAGAARPLAWRSVEAVAMGSLLAGALAAVAMLLVAAVSALALGESALLPPRLVAATFSGAWALGASAPGPVLVGLLVHFCLSMTLALLFAAALGLTSSLRASAWGLVYGLGVAVLMRFVVLPALNPPLASSPAIPFLIAHLVWGAALGTVPWLARSRDRTHLPAHL